MILLATYIFTQIKNWLPVIFGFYIIIILQNFLVKEQKKFIIKKNNYFTYYLVLDSNMIKNIY